MNKKILYLMFLLSGLIFQSCEREEAAVPYITDDTVYFTADAGSKSLTVFNAGDNVLSVSPVSEDWCKASVDGDVVVIEVSANTDENQRNVSLEIVCGNESLTVEVVQFAAGDTPDDALPKEIPVDCGISRIAIGYVESLSGLSVDSDVDWIDPFVEKGTVIMADIAANTENNSRTGAITVYDGEDFYAVVHIIQEKYSDPKVSYTYECYPQGLEYLLAVDVEYLSNATDYRMLIINPSGFNRPDSEIYERLTTGTTADYVFSRDDEDSEGKIVFGGFELGQEFQVCIVAESSLGTFGAMTRETHVIEDSVSGEGSQEYNSWIGEWSITGSNAGAKWNISISAAVVDEIFYMQGWDGIWGNFKVPLYFDSETGALSFRSTYVSNATTGTGRPCDLYFFAMYDMTPAADTKIAAQTGDEIARAEYGENGSTVITAVPFMFEGSSVTPDGMGYVGQYSTGYEIVSDIVLIPRFPMSMVRTGGAALAPAGTDRGDDFVSLK